MAGPTETKDLGEKSSQGKAAKAEEASARRKHGRKPHDKSPGMKYTSFAEDGPCRRDIRPKTERRKSCREGPSIKPHREKAQRAVAPSGGFAKDWAELLGPLGAHASKRHCMPIIISLSYG